jgi:hypothetical protein
MLELLPSKQLHLFSEAIKTLIAKIEDLRFGYSRNTLLKCPGYYCRWKDVEFTYDNPRDREIFNSVAQPIRDLVSFETRLTLVESPRYRLKTLLRDMYDHLNDRGPPDSILKSKFKKVLTALDIHKSKGFSDYMDQFVNVIYREAFILLESLPEDESSQLRKSINEFNATSWKMRDLREESDSELPRYGFPQADEVGKPKVSSDSETDSDYPGLSEVGERALQHILNDTNPPRIKVMLEKDFYKQHTHAVTENRLEQCHHAVTNQCNTPEQCQHTGMDTCVTPPRRSFPIVSVEHNITTWKYHSDYEPISDESENESPDLTLPAASAAEKLIEETLRPLNPYSSLNNATSENENEVREKPIYV